MERFPFFFQCSFVCRVCVPRSVKGGLGTRSWPRHAAPSCCPHLPGSPSACMLGRSHGLWCVPKEASRKALAPTGSGGTYMEGGKRQIKQMGSILFGGCQGSLNLGTSFSTSRALSRSWVGGPRLVVCPGGQAGSRSWKQRVCGGRGAAAWLVRPQRGPS